MRIHICGSCEKEEICRTVYNYRHPKDKSFELRIWSKLTDEVIELHGNSIISKLTYSDIPNLSYIHYNLLTHFKHIKNEQLTNSVRGGNG